MGRLSHLRPMVGVLPFLGFVCIHSVRRASIAYGHPYMIDVQDCDTRLPSSGDSTDLYMDELVRLSILLGRVQKTIYR